jgi:hypothetical protein
VPDGDRRASDWSRLLHRMGPNWRVLLSHLVQFGFIYPGEPLPELKMRSTHDEPAWAFPSQCGNLSSTT